ncbi:MAG: phosphate regulon sensor histidine kinase PhoR [Gammaproteobacteria bacterium]|nr:phosphate regulon sensor histidine kinase PhoR [Gammaproteobacteria bacterium]MCY4228409.1 phosphate regulon sensor histidine kinase PhoR [Gammaproteobacteria bacterium]
MIFDNLLTLIGIGVMAGGTYLLGRYRNIQANSTPEHSNPDSSQRESQQDRTVKAEETGETADSLEDFRDNVSWLPDAITILDHDLNLIWGNSMAETWFGFSNSEHSHSDFSELIKSDEIKEFMMGKGYPESFECASPTDPELILRLRFLPYKNRQYLLQARDITQIRALENIRRDFIANASHELRTPVSILYGYLEMMSEKKGSGISSEWRQAIKHMHKQTIRIKQIIEDLSILSRLENPDTANPLEALDMGELIESASNNAKALSGERSHSILTKVNASHDLLGNRSEIESLVSNLVSNAIHYTPAEGKITIKWDVKSSVGTLSIADTGIGIEKQDLPRITERFYRVDSSRPRNTGGTGLGLAIVNHIVNRNNAKLRIKSIPKQGSVFSVIFPRSRIQPSNRSTDLLFG